MCCDGTYLSWAPVVEGDDREGLASIGHPIRFAEARGDYFDLPCPALVDKCCTVYGHRPSICPSYRCGMLNRFASGLVSTSDALATIARTLEVRDRVRPAMMERLGQSEPKSMYLMYSELEAWYDAAPDPTAARTADAALLADIGMLRLLLKKYFEKRDAITDDIDMTVSQA